MSGEWRRFVRHRKTFIQSIDVTHLLPLMTSSAAFTARDEDEVMGESRRHARAEALLDMVGRRGPMALQVFQDALAQYYPNLYFLLTDDEDDSSLDGRALGLCLYLFT